MSDEKTVDTEEVIKRLDDMNKEVKKVEEKKIIDMNVEELREALYTMIKFNQQVKKEHEEFVKKIDEVWMSKSKIKKRYLELRDRTIKK